jgi:hypothetical protein
MHSLLFAKFVHSEDISATNKTSKVEEGFIKFVTEIRARIKNLLHCSVSNKLNSEDSLVLNLGYGSFLCFKANFVRLQILGYDQLWKYEV